MAPSKGKATSKAKTSSKAKAPSKTKASSKGKFNLGFGLVNAALAALAAELQNYRDAPALVKRSDGKYEGDILGFVKGLRLSAGLIYYFRDKVEGHDLEVSWGHLLDKRQLSCSRECDVIIHTKGSIHKWNGTDRPIMEFKFIEAAKARAVISCKSILTSKEIDKDYPKELKKFGVKKVFLFAECSSASNFDNLRKKAKTAGYADLCCLYLTGPQDYIKTDERMWYDFGNKVLAAVK
jgi:hypothetical protein